jgi:hypothetical protein
MLWWKNKTTWHHVMVIFFIHCPGHLDNYKRTIIPLHKFADIETQAYDS